MALGMSKEDASCCCLGCQRWLVADVSGDLEGLTREDAIREANQDYPPELVAQHLGAQP